MPVKTPSGEPLTVTKSMTWDKSSTRRGPLPPACEPVSGPSPYYVTGVLTHSTRPAAPAQAASGSSDACCVTATAPGAAGNALVSSGYARPAQAYDGISPA